MTTERVILLIAAVSLNGVIGYNGRLPWRLSSDLKFFKKITMGKPMIMGRKTRESFGTKPLPQRSHIVLSREQVSTPDAQTYYVSNITQALALAETMHDTHTVIVGGGQIYELSLPYVTHAIITRVPHIVDGDTFFPDMTRYPHIEIQEYTPAQLTMLDKQGVFGEPLLTPKSSYPH